MNLLDLMIEVGVNDKASSGLDKIVGNVKSTAEKLSTGFKTALDVGTKISTVAAGAFAALGGAALSATGELEQNSGGMLQVFKENATEMEAIAKSAYTNMGLSASGFMGTANQIGALLQGSGFGIAESATLAADVMQRASDVASIMGIDISRAMESITGAAKGNFTMMDNLGVAINDNTIGQYALSKGITTSTREMSTQQKVGLALELFMEKSAYAAGNYARENQTLAGSLNTAKAAMNNFLSGAGSASAVADSFVAAAQTITASLTEIIPRLSEGFKEMAGAIIPELTGIFETALPAIIDGTKTLLTGFAQTLPELVRIVIEQLPTMVQGIKEIGVVLVDSVKDVADDLIVAFTDAFKDITGIDLTPLLDSVTGVVDLIRNTLGNMLQGVDLAGVGSKINGFLTTIGGAITTVVTAMQGESFQNFVSALMGMLTTIGGSLVSALKPAADGLKELFTAFLSGDSGVIQAIANAFGSFAEWFKNSLAPIIGDVASSVVELLKPFVDGISVIIVAIADALGKLFGWFDPTRSEAAKKLSEAVVRIIGVFTEGLAPIIENVAGAIGKFITAITSDEGSVNWFAEVISKLAEDFETSLGYVMDLATEISDLALSLADLRTDAEEVFTGISDILGTAIGQMALKLDDMVTEFETAFGKIDGLWGNTAIGGFFKLFSDEGLATANDWFNKLGELPIDVVKDADEYFKQKKHLEPHSELVTQKVPIEDALVSKVIEDQNTYLAQMQTTHLQTPNTPSPGFADQTINMVMDGRTIGEAVLPHIMDAAKRRGISLQMQR